MLTLRSRQLYVCHLPRNAYPGACLKRKEAVDLGEVGFVELPGATVGPAANTAVPSAKSLHAVATRQEIPTSLHPPTRLTAIVDVGGVHCRSPWDNSLSRASCSGRILWSHISLPGLTARSCSRLLVGRTCKTMTSEQQFKTYAVDALSREICALSGNVFETWAYALLPFVVPNVHWHHRGTTALGAPVGYTIDSSGDQATCVAQFSSLRNYFTTTKPVDDLKSTIAKHPQTKEIWLLAAVESSPSDRTESDNAIATWKLVNPGITVRDFDSRQIAALIVENLESDELVRLLQDRLPSLARIADENAFSHSVPEMGAYVTRPDAESATRDLLSTNRYAIIGGLSGVGKSALAVSIIRTWDAETRVWLDASDLANPEQLKSISVGRRGLSHNLVNILRTRRCCLVPVQNPIQNPNSKRRPRRRPSPKLSAGQAHSAKHSSQTGIGDCSDEWAWALPEVTRGEFCFGF